MDVEDPVDKVMHEKGVDREAAYGLVKDREERKMIEERHTSIVIPKQLQQPNYRFIRIRMEKRSDADDTWRKAPLEGHWTTTGNYTYDNPVLIDWIKKGNNYGVAHGFGGSICLDGDSEAGASAILERTNTFTVQTGGDGVRVHAYYVCKDDSSSFVAKTKDKKTFIEFKSKGNQTIGPGSIHQSGRRYVILRDIPIASITIDELKKMFPEMMFEQKIKKEADPSFEEIRRFEIDYDNPEMKKLLPLDTFEGSGKEQRKGPSPIHGPGKGGKNFSWHMEKQVWYCFHDNHNVGGGIIELIAIKEELINCTGKMTGEQRKEAMRIARDKYGVKYADRDKELLEKYNVIVVTKAGSKVVCPHLAELIYKEYGFHFLTADKTIYTYNGTHYVPNGEIISREYAQRLVGPLSTKRMKDEVVDWIRDHDGPKTTVEVFDRAPANLINIKNGVFDITTKTLLPPDPKYRFLSVLPVAYNKDAKPGRLLQFFMEVAPDSVETIQEMIGYSLYRKQALQKAFILIGSGRNGKSKLLTVIEHIVGSENAATIEIQQMKDKHYRAELYGKLVNIVGDLSSKDVEEDNSSVLKKLVGEDTVEARRMYGHPFKFYSNATNIFSCNVLPRFEDVSDGVVRKFIVIPFLNNFERGMPGYDEDILDKLLTQEQTEWLFGWAVDGLLRAIKNKGFTGTKSIENTGEMFDMMSSPTKAFVIYSCDIEKTTSWIFKDVFKARLFSYCRENRIPIPNDRQIRQALLGGFPTIKEVKKEDDKARKLAWWGMDWNEDTLKKIADEEEKPKNKELPMETTSDTVSQKIVETSRNATSLNDMSRKVSSMSSMSSIQKHADFEKTTEEVSSMSLMSRHIPITPIEKQRVCNKMFEQNIEDIEDKAHFSPSGGVSSTEKVSSDIKDIEDTSDTVSHIVVETSRTATSLNDMPQHDRIAEVRNYVLRTQPVTMVALLDHFEPDAFIYDLIQRGLLVRVPDKTFEKYEWMKD
jgi:P4 family phage/plasmid primase-like protien